MLKADCLELNKIFTGLAKRMRTQVHGAGCSAYATCPEGCACFNRRKYPLGLHTAMLWTLGHRLERCLDYAKCNRKDVVLTAKACEALNNDLKYSIAVCRYHRANPQVRQTYDILVEVKAALFFLQRMQRSKNPGYDMGSLMNRINNATRIPNLGGRL